MHHVVDDNVWSFQSNKYELDIFTDLCHEGSHLKSQLCVHREVSLLNLIINLVGQQEALSLSLSFHLSSETQPAQAQM